MKNNITFLFIVIPYLTFASSAFIVLEDFEDCFLGEYLELYEDMSGELSLTEILELDDDQWIRQNSKQLAKNITSSVFWTRIKLINQGDVARNLVVALENPLFDRVQFFELKDKILFEHSALMGDMIPYNKRNINHRFFIQNIILEPSEAKDIYILATKVGGQFTYPLKLYDSERWAIKNVSRSLRNGLNIGALIFMIFGLLIGYLVFRVKYVIYFMGQVVFVLLFFVAMNGQGYQYLWPNTPYFQQIVTITSVSLVFYIKCLFLSSFFEFDKSGRPFRHLRYARIGLIIGMIIPVFFLFMSSFLRGDQSLLYSIFDNVIVVAGILGHGSIIIALFLILRTLFLASQKSSRQGYLLFFLLTLGQLGYMSFGYLIYFGVINIPGLHPGPILSLGYLIEGLVIIYFLLNYYRVTSERQRQLKFQLSLKKNEALNNLLLGQEQERERISQELHDGLSIRLTEVRSSLSKLKDSLNGKSEGKIPFVLKELDVIHEDIRNVSHALNPKVLQDLGLKNAINDVIYAIEMNHLDLDIQFDFDEKQDMSDSQKKHFYFIIQELLNNTIKHAKANEINIFLGKSNGKMMLTYYDDGIGYDLESVKSDGIGIKNIQSRVDIMDATMDIEKIDPFGMMYNIVVSN